MTKTNNFIVLGYFLLPIILFNTPNNFIQLNLNDLLIIILAQSLILTLCIVSSTFLYFYFKKV